MYYDLEKMEFGKDYKLELFFEDGHTGVVDFQEYISKGGVFIRLADKGYFRQAMIDKERGVLFWPDNLDVAPETLYHQATGQPLPA